MKKQLPYTEPFISGLQNYGYVYGMISDDVYFDSWLCNHYTQLWCISNYDKYNDLWFSFCDGNVLGGLSLFEYTYYEKKPIIDTKESLVSFLINAINEDNYVYMMCDIFYVPHTEAYQKRHHIHDLFLSGYIIEKDHITFQTYHYNEKGQFGDFSIDSDQLLQALQSSENESFMFAFILLKTRKCFDFTFNISELIVSLQDFILSKRPRQKSGEESILDHVGNSCKPFEGLRKYYTKQVTEVIDYRVWGISTYDYLISYHSSMKQGNAQYDIRPLHILYEHKKCMLRRLTYLKNTKKVQSFFNYDYYVKKTLNIKYLGLKYAMVLNPLILDKINSDIEELKKVEAQSIQELLFALNRSS